MVNKQKFIDRIRDRYISVSFELQFYFLLINASLAFTLHYATLLKVTNIYNGSQLFTLHLGSLSQVIKVYNSLINRLQVSTLY